MDQFGARREAVSGIPRQCPGDHETVAGGQQREVGGILKLGVQRCVGRTAAKRSHTGQHFLINDGQSILIRIATDVAGERLRGGVGRTQPAAHQAVMVDIPHQAEVADFQPAAHQEQIGWLDVEMLELKLFGHVVQGVGGVLQMAEQLRPCDAVGAPRRGTRQSVTRGSCPPVRSR